MKKYFYLIVGFLGTPMMSFAQGRPGNDVRSLLDYFRGVFNNNLIPLSITLALVYFIWAVVGFMSATGDASKREEKKKQIFWGLTGLLVILSVWALVAIVGNTFNVFRGGTLETR